MKQAGLGEYVKQVEAGNCPICKKSVDGITFKNELSLKEFHISGMCQACQDDIFG